MKNSSQQVENPSVSVEGSYPIRTYIVSEPELNQLSDNGSMYFSFGLFFSSVFITTLIVLVTVRLNKIKFAGFMSACVASVLASAILFVVSYQQSKGSKQVLEEIMQRKCEIVDKSPAAKDLQSFATR